MESEKRLASSWEMMHKNNDGDAVVTTLHKYEYQPDVENIEELIVNKAAPTIINPSTRRRPRRPDFRTVVAGDAQIPFHDETAFNNFQRVILETKPDNIVLLGDMVDLASMSKFEQRAEWVRMAQDSIDTYHKFLAQTRANSPDSKLFVIHGNHEKRFGDYVQRNASELLGLKRANAAKELGVLTLQHLVRYEDLEVNCIDGYPNGTLWLEDNLKCIHGTNVAKGGYNVGKYLREERESTIFGHTHRQEMAFRTFAHRIGAVTIAAASPGCLANIEGIVPGFRHSVTASGDVVKRAEDWQQGVLVIDHSKDNHNIVPVKFNDNGFYLDGKFHKN